MAAGTKMTIVLDPHVYELLREFAFVENYRSRNHAVSEIVADAILEWERVYKSSK